jgi:hypothetical protein
MEILPSLKLRWRMSSEMSFGPEALRTHNRYFCGKTIWRIMDESVST